MIRLRLSMNGSELLLCSSSRPVSSECRSPGISCPAAFLFSSQHLACVTPPRNTPRIWKAASGWLCFYRGNSRPWSTSELSQAQRRKKRKRRTPEAAASGWDLKTTASNFSNLKFSSEMKYETKSFQDFFFAWIINNPRLTFAFLIKGGKAMALCSSQLVSLWRRIFKTKGKEAN